MKKFKKPKKQKYAVWLSNHTDDDDDEAMGTFATSEEKAEEIFRANIDSTRFSMRHVLPIKEFRGQYGNYPLEEVTSDEENESVEPDELKVLQEFYIIVQNAICKIRKGHSIRWSLIKKQIEKIENEFDTSMWKNNKGE